MPIKIPFLEKLKPLFWDYEAADAGPFKKLFDFRRIWEKAVLLMACVAVLPLLSLASFDFSVTRRDSENEIKLRMARVVSNTVHTVSFFLEERKAALQFVVYDTSFVDITNEIRLALILENLQKSIGGVIDLGVFTPDGRQVQYTGPYQHKLEDKLYNEEDWFREVTARGTYVSDVFLGFRQVPHIVIAVRHDLSPGSFYILRVTLDTKWFNELLTPVKESGIGDTFLINLDGVIQTPSLAHGEVLVNISFPVPQYSSQIQVLDDEKNHDSPVIMGCSYIRNSPFILVIVEEKDKLMRPWRTTRYVVFIYLAVSVAVIILVVHGVATRLVNGIFLADQHRILTLREVEHTSRLASIGRLAAGVAHEINNPLAIINEKAGLIKDIFSFRQEYPQEKLIGSVNSILSSVQRCSAITKRLLGFARHLEMSFEPVELKAVIEDVLGFFGKEAEYRSISITVDFEPNIPVFESDRGKLQQIFLNLVNNAFAAMSDGGKLDILVQCIEPGTVTITVADNGHGIPQTDIKRIFEPFFSTKKNQGGTGLGLSITYGLVQELGGKISVESALGRGAKFTITLPLTLEKKEKKNASTPC